MTLETLQQCRNAAHALQKVQKAINIHESGAGCISGMHYGDMPRGRGEPISSQEAYIEKKERLEEELNQKKTMYQNLKCEVLHAVSSLPRLQRQLICGYYVHGHSWDTVNRICGVKRQQSIYQVRKAFDKILEKA